MKKLFYFLTVVILFSATACSDSKKGKGLSNFKNIKVEGTINNKYPVHLQLSNNSGKITGTCVYTESNNEEGLKIVGIIKPNGSMQLQEKDENGVICGTFDGMISDGDYTGTYTNKKGKKMPFALESEGLNFHFIPDSKYAGTPNDESEVLTKKKNQDELGDRMNEEEAYETQQKENEEEVKMKDTSLTTKEKQRLREICDYFSQSLYFDLHNLRTEIQQEIVNKVKNNDLSAYSSMFDYLNKMRQDCVLYDRYDDANDIFTKMFDLAKMGEKQEDPMMTFWLGACYGEFGVNKDLKKAVQYYEKAANLGNAQGCMALGFCYRDGLGVSINRRTAAEWFREAFNRGIDAAEREWLNCIN